MNEKQTGRFRKSKSNFTIVSNKILQDSKISLKAKGLYGVINSYLSIPNFELYKSFLASNCKEGRDNFDKIWKELKDTGYLKIYKIQTDNGKFFYEYELLDEPDFTKEAMETYRIDKNGELIKSPPKKNKVNENKAKKLSEVNINIEFDGDML